MTTQTSAPTAPSSHVQGLRCRRCGQPQAIGPSFVCPACFGPLEVVYDLAVARATMDAAAIAARPAGIWRYLELLPVDAPPARGLAVGGTALVRADRLAKALGVATVWLKDDSRNPTLSFKDRVVAMAAARAVEFGFDTLACASTGNLAGATAAAAAVAGLHSVVFIPADLEPAKIAHALAYGATVVPVRGTYDQVNRLSLEVAGEVPWAFVNVNLRPYYAEGSKTLAFEIAEQLGWRLPDVIVAPLASGSLYVKTGKAVDELIEVGLVESRPVRFVGGQAGRVRPHRATRSAPARRSSSRSANRTPSSSRWPSATRPTAPLRSTSRARAAAPSRACPTAPRSRPSASWRRPRASTPRRPAGSRWPPCSRPSRAAWSARTTRSSSC